MGDAATYLIAIVLVLITIVGQLAMVIEAIKAGWAWAIGVLLFGLLAFIPLYLSHDDINPEYALMSFAGNVGLALLMFLNPSPFEEPRRPRAPIPIPVTEEAPPSVIEERRYLPRLHLSYRLIDLPSADPLDRSAYPEPSDDDPTRDLPSGYPEPVERDGRTPVDSETPTSGDG